MVHNLLKKKLVENASTRGGWEEEREERLLNSASYFDLRGRLSLTNPAQEAALYATTVHIYGLRLKTLLQIFYWFHRNIRVKNKT